MASQSVTYVAHGNQERYLLAERFTDASYPIPYSYWVSGAFDAEQFQSAMDCSVERHPILRTWFRSDTEGFVADVLPHVSIQLSRHPMPGADRAEAEAYVSVRFSSKLDGLTPDQMFRALLVSTADDRHLLTISLHHAIGDAISMDTLVRELFALYSGQSLPPAATAFHETAASQPLAADEAERLGHWWRTRLDGVAEIPTLKPDVSVANAPAGDIKRTLAFAQVSQLATAAGVSPFSLMLSATLVLMERVIGTRDMLVTMQSSGRKPWSDSDDVIGPFSNSLSIRRDVDPGLPFARFAQGVADEVAAVLAHEKLPYHVIVRETGVQPRIGVNWFPAEKPLDVPGLAISEREFLYYDSNYDLNIRFVREGADLHLLIHFDAASLGDDRVQQFASRFQPLLDALDADILAPLHALPPLPIPFAVPSPPPLAAARMYDAFLDMAAATPERAAILGDERVYTYADVERRSAAVASRLLHEGLGPGSRIAIVAERGPRLVWTMMAVLRIGATMVMLDAEYPAERLQTLVQVSRPQAFLVPGTRAVGDWIPAGFPVISVAAHENDSVDESLTADSLSAGSPSDAAYILFTSGSTGTPKGIATSHGPVLNFLQWQREKFGFTASDRFTNLCGVAHDMMIRDVFAPLSIGAQLAIPAQETIFKPGALLDWCRAQRPTISHLTPAMGKLLAMADDAGPASGERLRLRHLFFGGDRLTPEIARAMQRLSPGVQVVNFYGATETPQAAAFHICDPVKPWRTVPIGRGVDHVSIRIADEAGNPVPQGMPGEIHVLSPFLSLGYVKEGEIVPHLRPDRYPTGDGGFELPTGEIVFTGRNDDQISIRGYRIELGEIATVLASHADVREAQVLADGTENPRLVAFATGDDLDSDVLYAWLSERLPGYMVPADILCLDRMPLLPNGKLDRKALLARPRPERGGAGLRLAETSLEQDLVVAWQQILGIAAISPEQSFAALRGDSLAYVQVFLATEARVGVLPEDWATRSLADLAASARTTEERGPWRRWWRSIDSSMLVRACAIFLIVAFHLKAVSYGGGATSALLMVSGFLIGRLQLHEVARTRSVQPFTQLFVRVLIPSFIYVSLYFGTKTLLGRPVSWTVLFLMEDFVDFRRMGAGEMQAHAFFLWYICAFLHMLLLLIAVTAWAVRPGGAPFTAAKFATIGFIVSLPLKFLLPGLFDREIFASGIAPLSVWGYAPTSHLSTLLLGACIASARDRRTRLIWAGVTVVYAALTWVYVPSNSFVIMAIVGMLLIYVPRLPLPKGLHLVVLTLSSASLFIYLTHMQIANSLTAIGMPAHPVLQVPAAVIGGVLVWYFWQKIQPVARKLSPI